MLNSYGCVPNKSKILQFPKYIQHPYAFIRGYMDGDGSIGIYNNKLYCSCIGTKNMLDEILRYTNISKKLGRDKRWSLEIFNFQLSGQKCYKFLHKIYNNASVYLDRKFNLYIKICRL